MEHQTLLLFYRMEFGKHIGKGLWASADKALPAVYGIGIIFLVIRVLPEHEYGAFSLIQSIIAFTVGLGTAFALQPLTKFAAETDEPGGYIVSSLFLQFIFYVILTCGIFVFREKLADVFDPKHQIDLVPLFNFIPFVFLTAFYRNFAVSLLAAKYQIQKIFWIDAVFFLGVPLFIYIASKFHYFHTAADALSVNVVAFALSTATAILMTRKEMSVKLAIDRETFIKMWNFGKYSFVGNAMYALFTMLDILFVSSYLGIVAVAVYSAAKVFMRLYDMVSQVLAMFLVPFSSKAYSAGERDKLQQTAEKAVCFSSLLLLPLFLILFLFPDAVLQILYKGKYAQAAGILRVFSLLAFIVPWNAVVTSYIVGTGKVKEVLYFSVILIAIAVPSYAFLTSLFGAVGTSIGLVFSFLVVTLLLVRYLQQIIPLKVLSVIKRTKDALMFVKTKLRIVYNIFTKKMLG